MKARLSGQLVVALACALGAVACGNPVQDKLRESLGHEKRGVPRGPLHRPGQPCVVCHSAAGGVEPHFSVAGTIYQTQADEKPAQDVLVVLKDSAGHAISVDTNCAGNFYVQEKDFNPVYPIKPELHYGNLPTLVHKTQIFRWGSCAHCHTDPVSATSPGHVYMDPNAIGKFAPGCP